MLDWYRGEDAGDFKKSEFYELVDNLTRLNALEGKIWKSNPKIVTDEKSNPKVVTDKRKLENLEK